MAARYYFVRIICDNHVKLLINDSIIYDKAPKDIHEPDEFEITSYLQPQPYVNKLKILGYNGPSISTNPADNPWRIKYNIQKRVDSVSEIIAENDQGGPPITAPLSKETFEIIWTHEILKE